MWHMLADTSQVEAWLAEAEARAKGDGVEKVAASIASSLSEATAGAFASKRDPRTRRPWESAAESTTRSRGYKSLLRRSGELESAVQTGYQLVPVGATVKVEIVGDNDIVRRGMVHMYGVRARAKRSNRRTRRNPNMVMPARRFVGMWREDVDAAVKLAERELVPES